jgi:hypothetical protein
MVNAYNEVYLYLQEIDLTFWGQTSAVPDEVANEISAMMAWRRVNDYGVSNERYQRLAQEVRPAEMRIRTVAVNQYKANSEPEDF